MKKSLPVFAFILSAMILLTACPYSSVVPVTAPGEKIEKKLLGKWIKSSEYDSEHPEFFDITKSDKFLYRIEKNEYNTSDSIYDKTVYVSHTSELGDYLFINMRENGEGDYYIYRIDLDKDKGSFTLFEVTDNIDEKFSTSDDLRKFVDKYKELSFFYNSDEKTYIKQD